MCLHLSDLHCALYAKLLSKPRLVRVGFDHPHTSERVEVVGRLAWIDYQKPNSSDRTGPCKLGIYFACTDGGATRKGQIWRYVPSRFEGQPDERRFPGRLELFIEPNDRTLVENCDNLTLAPWGDLILCEDGPQQQFVVGVRPDGSIYRLAENAINHSEFAGATFSPDGSTLFLNVQAVGITMAITGPWPRA